MENNMITVMEKSSGHLIKENLVDALSYEAYRELVAKLAQEGGTTGKVQTQDFITYTQLNDKRMKRWDKTFHIDAETAKKIAAIDTEITWVVLTESWCGDASPALPVMNKIAALNPLIHLKIILRDDHMELMNRFLTNGAMSIPKLIAMSYENEEPSYTWGPRSKNATQLVQAYKAEHGKLTAEFKQDLQVWYNKDKGVSILTDLLAYLPLK